MRLHQNEDPVSSRSATSSPEPCKKSRKDSRAGADWDLLLDVALSGQQESAFLVCDSDEIRENVAEWKKQLGGVRPFFDVFCNSSALVLKLLSSLGCGFTCKAKDEMKAALAAGVQPEDIYFRANMLFGPNIKFAAKNGIGMVSFSSKAELCKIKKAYPEANLVLNIDLGQPDDAFLDLLRLSSSAGMNVVGVSFAGNWSSDLICRKMAAMAKLAFVAGRSLGHGNMNVIDVGTPDLEAFDFQMLKSSLESSLEHEFGHEKTIRVLGHTKDTLVSSAFKLAVKVLGKRIARADPSGLRTYVLNDGIYGCFGRVLMDEDAADAFKPVPLMPGDDDEALFPTDLWGPSGDDIDVIGRRFPLPDVEEDEWIVFENMGAYLMTPGAMSEQMTAFEASDTTQRDLWLLIKTASASPMSDEDSPLSSPEGPSLSSSLSNLNDPALFRNLPFASFTLDFDPDGNCLAELPAAEAQLSSHRRRSRGEASLTRF